MKETSFFPSLVDLQRNRIGITTFHNETWRSLTDAEFILGLYFQSLRFTVAPQVANEKRVGHLHWRVGHLWKLCNCGKTGPTPHQSIYQFNGLTISVAAAVLCRLKSSDVFPYKGAVKSQRTILFLPSVLNYFIFFIKLVGKTSSVHALHHRNVNVILSQ